MPKRQYMLNSLSRKRIRASWNKYNLYNLTTWRKTFRRGTLYQQKFSAKQESRSYHGEHLTETQFRNVFRGQLNGVNPLQATRSRKDAADTAQAEIPWAMQTYVALERRLDTALFRAMFASSVRQASQFIIRGAVKVNGVKIKQPGFALKPGDVLAVNPDYVLTALGRKKPAVQESVEIVNRLITRFNRYITRAKKSPEIMWKLKQRHRSRHPAFASKSAAKQAAKNRAWNSKIQKEMNSQIDKVSPAAVLETILKNEAHFEAHGTLPFKVGLNSSLTVLGMVTGRKIEAGKTDIPESVTSESVTSESTTSESANSQANQVQDQVKSDTSESEPPIQSEQVDKVEAASESSSATTPQHITEIVNKYFSKEQDGPGNKSDVKKILSDIVKEQQEDIRKTYTEQLREKGSEETYDPTWTDRLPEPIALIDAEAAKEDINSVLPLKLPFTTGKLYGLADPSKGYFTPWAPRQFLAPFAILPHHLEISFKTCHAVYLRDPVARPGQSELISPFPLDMHERAHMFYDNRKRKF